MRGVVDNCNMLETRQVRLQVSHEREVIEIPEFMRTYHHRGVDEAQNELDFLAPEPAVEMAERDAEHHRRVDRARVAEELRSSLEESDVKSRGRPSWNGVHERSPKVAFRRPAGRLRGPRS